MVRRAIGEAERRHGGDLLPEACAPGAREAVGDIVDGRYVLVKRAGAGTAGTVWIARDLDLGIDVAVKLVRGGRLDRPTTFAHFAREADVASRMHSPHIARVLASGSTEAHGPYVVYEQLDGEDLADRLAARRRLAIVEMRNVVVQTCRALSRTHALGIVHRDIKPSNLFLCTAVDGGEVVKVLDFGLADVVGGSDLDPNTLVGTLEYIAPEVLFGESAPDARSDLYALAVVAYECLTGDVPFAAGFVEELVAAYATRPLTPPSALRRGLSPEIDAWFDRALCRDPAGRFQSAKEMADALDEAIGSMDRAPASSDAGIRIDVSSTAVDLVGRRELGDTTPLRLTPRYRSTIRPRAKST